MKYDHPGQKNIFFGWNSNSLRFCVKMSLEKTTVLYKSEIVPSCFLIFLITGRNRDCMDTFNHGFKGKPWSNTRKDHAY